MFKSMGDTTVVGAYSCLPVPRVVITHCHIVVAVIAKIRVIVPGV